MYHRLAFPSVLPAIVLLACYLLLLCRSNVVLLDQSRYLSILDHLLCPPNTTFEGALFLHLTSLSFYSDSTQEAFLSVALGLFADFANYLPSCIDLAFVMRESLLILRFQEVSLALYSPRTSDKGRRLLPFKHLLVNTLQRVRHRPNNCSEVFQQKSTAPFTDAKYKANRSVFFGTMIGLKEL